MYLENIHREPNETDSDIANNVRSFSKEHRLNIVRVQVVRNWRSDDIVGCRIVISETMVPIVTADGYWPDRIRCRPWQKKKTEIFKLNKYHPTPSSKVTNRVINNG